MKFNFSILDKALADCKSVDEQAAFINAVISRIHEQGPFKNEPVGAVQWVKGEEVYANDYNPNSVANPEMELLAHSIRADGYTQPIVTMKEDAGNQVIDGFHRNRVGKEQTDIRERLHGYLPIVSINSDRMDQNDRMASTIRHNRARGKHKIDAMSDIVVELKRRNWSEQRIGKELGMDPDEVLRLLQINGLADMFSDQEFSEAWQHSGEVDEDAISTTDESVNLEWAVLKVNHKPGWYEQTASSHLLYGKAGQLLGSVRKSHFNANEWFWKAYTSPMQEGRAESGKQGKAKVAEVWKCQK